MAKEAMSQEEKNMNDEHKRLASVVKNVHANLRKKLRANNGDYETVWKQHCKDQSALCQYAQCMQKLATDHWTKNSHTRIDWCREVILEYFNGSGLEKALEKDAKRQRHKLQKEEQQIVSDSCCVQNEGADPTQRLRVQLMQDRPDACPQRDADVRDDTLVQLPLEGKVRLLDVGSCYNPFCQFDEFLPIAIDISPANELVYQCDFLSLEITEPLHLAPDAGDTFLRKLSSPIERLPHGLFHVVVFSLLLEYLPAPQQRWLCCVKAHQLLQCHGLLLIVTPDSHSQHRNAPMMRSWRTAIESMGFHRWRYVKHEHLHCMAFRKLHQRPSVPCGVSPDMMYIPQDFSDKCLDDELNESSHKEVIQDECEDRDDFFQTSALELPCFIPDDGSGTVV